MGKKTKTIIALLISALLLSSCSGSTPANTETTAANVSENTETTEAESPQTTEAATEETAADKTEAKEEAKPVHIQELTLFDIYKTKFYPEIDGEKFLEKFETNGRYMRTFRESGIDGIVFDGAEFHVLLRETSGAIERGENNKSVSQKAKSTEKNRYYNLNNLKEFTIGNPVFNVSCKSDGTINVDRINLSYYLRFNDNIKARAFVKLVKSEPYTLDVIIDPAYMYGIPMFSNNEKYMNFDINGTKVTADTLKFRCIFNGSNLDLGIPKSHDYFYAEVALNNFTVNFDTFKGYDNRVDITDIKLITEDTDSIIDSPFINSIDKDPVMSEVYNAIMSEQKKFLSKDSYGVVLADLDFDGIPEVLNSHYAILNNSENDYNNSNISDVDVYRVKNGKLVLTGTMSNKFMIIDDITNTIGLKTLPDGTKGWFATSYKNRDTGETSEIDYIYTLEGDTLKHREIFSTRPNGIVNEYGYEGEDFYYMGEKMEIKTVHHELTEIEKHEPFAAEETYSWNNIGSNFGEWEIYGLARKNFCNDIKEIYKLYSDWMCSVDYYNGFNGVERYDVTEREFSYKMAYAVDAAFLGSYNKDLMENRYNFLGYYAKPVIYLYPEEETELSVSLDFTYGGELTCTYPEYNSENNSGWNVTAMSDGTLYDENGDEYYCLYWEADGNAMFDSSKGFCVKGEDTAAFLREKLMYIGLSVREANEFIIYWLPKLQDNEYNVITFHTDDYADSVPLTLSVKPDTEIRVFMTYYGSGEPVEIEEQTLPHYERNGFTLVEWGGSEE